LRKI